MKWVMVCFYLTSCGNYAIKDSDYYNSEEECEKAASDNNKTVDEWNARPPVSSHRSEKYGCTPFLLGDSK